MTNLINYIIVNQRLARSVQDTRVFRSTVNKNKSKDHHLAGCGVNLEPKFRNDNCIPGSYNLSKIQDVNSRENFQVQLNTKLKSLKCNNLEKGWISFWK